MKFSENWLRSLVAISVDRATLCHRLTMAGLEVEAVEALGDGLEGVQVAEILAVEPHPQAEKLRVCRVATGAAAPIHIVCGAANVRPGLKVPLATMGTVLPSGQRIERTRLRGIESEGMLCSAKELGLDGDHSGLMELPDEAPVGLPLAQWLGLPDASIEIKLTPNRSDCLSIAGLAAEVASIFALPRPEQKVSPVEAVGNARCEIQIESPGDCPRYLGRVIENINPESKTPSWMVQRLRRAGLRPIGVVVDCTNYVMLELGQPMHAFDRDQLSGPVIVRRARSGERIKLLDEREVELDPEFLAIADANGPIAVAGVMGGWSSRVTAHSRNLFLESAHFTPAAIIGRARRLGLHTDASHRFERGVDAELPRRAIERLTGLLVSIAGGVPGPVSAVEHLDLLPPARTITLRDRRLVKVLGMDLPRERVVAVLAGLGMQVEPHADGWTVQPPSARFDLAIEEDLIEEVARVFGYDQLPVTIPNGILRVGAMGEACVPDAALRQHLVARGYVECIHLAFVSQSLLTAWGLDRGAVGLANPLSAELAVMRTALLPGLVETARRNLSRQQSRLRLFEIGRVFAAMGEDHPPRETTHLAGMVLGSAQGEHWDSGRRAVDFFDVKGDIEHLLALAAAADARFEQGGPDWLHPGRSATLWRGQQNLGYLGALHPGLLSTLDIDREIWVFELNFDGLTQRNVPRVTDWSRLPAVRRDLALVLPESVTWSAVQHCVHRTAGPLLRDLHLFDEYRGHGLKPGTRSLAIGLILQDLSRTLTDADVDGVVVAVVAALSAQLQAELRR